MSSNFANRVPYLITSRSFPKEGENLVDELDRTYIDIANAVNSRTIGIFPNIRPAITGETWYLRGGNKKQQSLRQVYPFTYTSSPFLIPHGIILSRISGFVRIWGTFVDAGGIWYPLPYVDATAASNQVSISVDSTDIVITVGAGAPVPVTGICVLEWLGNA